MSLPSPVLPPQRPLPHRSRSEARRIAGTSSRSRQPTGDLRPPSHRPGQGPGRGQSPFLLSAASGGGNQPNHFSSFHRGVYVTKNPSHAATCKTEVAPRGLLRFCAQAECEKEAASGIAGGSFLPSCQRLSDAGTGPFLAGMFLGTFRRNIFMPCGRSPGRPRSCGPPCP